MIPRAARSTLFPYATLFRTAESGASRIDAEAGRSSRAVGDAHRSSGNHHVLVHGQTRAVGYFFSTIPTDPSSVFFPITTRYPAKIEAAADLASERCRAFVPLI